MTRAGSEGQSAVALSARCLSTTSVEVLPDFPSHHAYCLFIWNSQATGDPKDIEGAKAKLAEVSPLVGRPGLALDVANAALWLASDESGYTTGHTLTTDAGITIGATAGPPNFADYTPIIREAGKSGLDD